MLKFENVTKVYEGGNKAVKNLTLDVDEGEFVVFIGPSGCGKTTTMKMVNRLIEPTEGNIYIQDENISEKDVVELRRSIGYVIQQIGLFPHMTVMENITLVPRLLNWPVDKRRTRAEELLQLVDMGNEFMDYYPHELSGGQQQRIGVLRALASDPPIILMDEPFGALDPITRDYLQGEFKKLQERIGKTIVFVTHDMDEALKLADRIVIMRAGEVVQVGTPEEILSKPANQFVEDFLSRERLLQSRPKIEKVEETMDTNMKCFTESTTLMDAEKIIQDEKADDYFVVDDQNVLKGVIQAESIYQHDGNTAVKDVMTTVTYSVEAGTLLSDMLQESLNSGVKNVPIRDGKGHLLGIIKREDLVDIVCGSILADESSLITT